MSIPLVEFSAHAYKDRDLSNSRFKYFFFCWLTILIMKPVRIPVTMLCEVFRIKMNIQAGWSGFDFRWDREELFLFALRPTQSPIQWVLKVLSTGVE